MRGDERSQVEMFACGSLDGRVPAEHPLRRVRVLTDASLRELKPVLDGLYGQGGRPSVPPEQMLRALLLQMLYTVRSERMLAEQMEYNLLFRWFVGLDWNGRVWDASSFSKNRERLLAGEVAERFFQSVLERARTERLLDDEHFTVDGSLIEAWASERSYGPRIGPQPRRGAGKNKVLTLRETHVSRTDPDAGMYRKGVRSGLRLCHMAHAVTENRHGLVVASSVSWPSPRAEREQGLRMLGGLRRTLGPRTVGADKGYHEQDFVDGLKSMGIAAHVPGYRNRRGHSRWTPAGLEDTPEYSASQKKRKWIERFFSWLKGPAGLRKTRHKGHRKLDWNLTFAAAAYNLVRMSSLLPAA